MRQNDFQKFYYNKVALGEGCGCAERIIDAHEFDRLSSKPKLRGLTKRVPLTQRLKSIFARRKATSDATKD